MGNYVNPGNSGFTRIRKNIYIDKTGLIRLVNQTIDTPRCLTCVSRPRRFGKSFAAKMLCAYYDKPVIRPYFLTIWQSPATHSIENT